MGAVTKRALIVIAVVGYFSLPIVGGFVYLYGKEQGVWYIGDVFFLCFLPYVLFTITVIGFATILQWIFTGDTWL